MKIIAIGGGKLALKQTLAIDSVVVDLVGRKHPRALFIPTASGDDEEYEQSFRRTYADELGCKVDCLRLLYPSGDRSNLRKRPGSVTRIFASSFLPAPGWRKTARPAGRDARSLPVPGRRL